MGKILKIFLGGDVCGELGLKTLKQYLPDLIKNEQIDFCVINGENTSNGIGIKDADAALFFDLGVDVITGGNHTLEKFDIRYNFGNDKRILRPHNFPFCPGSGIVRIEKNGIGYIVINLQGRENMKAIDCPFQTLDRIFSDARYDFPNSVVIIDFHAESNSEKEAAAFYVDGNVSAIVGTHTHTQTADERILPKGTAYITDIGMIGAKDSVIGGKIDIAIQRAKTQVPQKIETQNSGSYIFSGLIVYIDSESKKAVSVNRISFDNGGYSTL